MSQVIQAVTGVLTLLVTLTGVLFVVWQLRENSMVAWRTYLDEYSADLNSREQENAVAGCLFGHGLSPQEVSPLDEECRKIVFQSVGNTRSHIHHAEERLAHLREVDYFDYLNAPEGLQKRVGEMLAWFGFSGLTSELGPWYAGLRRELAEDHSDVVSFILMRWECWGKANAAACAEEKAGELGLCPSTPPIPNECNGRSGHLGCNIKYRCMDAEDFVHCAAMKAEELGLCTLPDECLCAGRVREKSDDFVERIKQSFPLGSGTRIPLSAPRKSRRCAAHRRR